MNIRTITIAVLAGLSVAAHAHDALASDPPAWRLSIAGGIEWAAPILSPNGDAIVLATTDGAVQVLDSESGEPRLQPPADTLPGVRLAGHVADTLVLFDREAIHAVRAPSTTDAANPEARRWRRIWSRPDQRAPRQDDPERTQRLIAARVTRHGVIVVRSDGMLGLFGLDDGSLLSHQRIDPLSACTLLVRDDHATILEHRGGTLHRHDFSVVAGRLQTRGECELEANALDAVRTDAGIVLIEPARIRMLAADCVTMDLPADADHPFARSRTIVQDAFSSPVPRPARVWSVDEQGRLRRDDLDTHRIHRAALDGGDWRLAQVEADRALLLAEFRVAVVRIAPFVRQCFGPVPGDAVVDARLTGHALHILCTRGAIPGETTSPGQRPGVRLLSMLSAPGDPMSFSAGTPRATRTDGRPRELLMAGDRIVIVADRELVAYTSKP